MKEWKSPQIKELNIENTACRWKDKGNNNPFEGTSGVEYPVKFPNRDSGESGPSGPSGESGCRWGFGKW